MKRKPKQEVCWHFRRLGVCGECAEKAKLAAAKKGKKK